MKNHAKPPIRSGTSHLEATGSTPEGRAIFSIIYFFLIARARNGYAKRG